MVSVHTSPLSALGGPDAGGLTVYVLSLAEQLARTGIEVDIFTRRFDPSEPDVVELSRNINVINITAGPVEKVPKDDLYCLLPDFASEMAMYALESGRRYDIIHTHYWLSGWVGRILKRYWDVPVVHMYHTLAHLKNDATDGAPSESVLRLRVERELISAVDQVVAPNPDERAELVWHLGAKDCQVCTLPPGIDLERFYPGNSMVGREQFGLPDAPLVLFVGRIDPIKDVDTLLESMSLLVQEFQGATPPQLVIVGGELDADGNPIGPLSSVQVKADPLGIADNIIFLGSRPQNELPALYSAATVVAVSSRYESFGLVAVEAMACGTPVVATRVGGMRFTVEENVSGLLVPPADPPAMATALRQVLCDEDLRSRMQVGARQAAIRFSWHTIGAAMQRMYERLADGDSDEPPCYSTIYAS
jgi:D-inositol-3-phosphate glycosyltransferase